MRCARGGGGRGGSGIGVRLDFAVQDKRRRKRPSARFLLRKLSLNFCGGDTFVNFKGSLNIIYLLAEVRPGGKNIWFSMMAYGSVSARQHMIWFRGSITHSSLMYISFL